MVACLTQEEELPQQTYPCLPGDHLVLIQNYDEVMWIETNSNSIGNLRFQYVTLREQLWISVGTV
jgi:hypothetical protein